MLARPLWILAVCALIATLRLGRGALIPVALAVLIAPVLSGVVEALRRYHIPPGGSVLSLPGLGDDTRDPDPGCAGHL